MEFSTFLNIIISSFYKVVDLLSKILNLLMQNNVFKLILYVALVFFIIEFLGKIFSITKNIFSMKKEAAKNKVDSKNNIE